MPISHYIETKFRLLPTHWSWKEINYLLVFLSLKGPTINNTKQSYLNCWLEWVIAVLTFVYLYYSHDRRSIMLVQVLVMSLYTAHIIIARTEPNWYIHPFVETQCLFTTSIPCHITLSKHQTKLINRWYILHTDHYIEETCHSNWWIWICEDIDSRFNKPHSESYTRLHQD